MEPISPSDFIGDGAAHESAEASADEEDGDDEGPEQIQRCVFNYRSVRVKNTLVAEVGYDLRHTHTHTHTRAYMNLFKKTNKKKTNKKFDKNELRWWIYILRSVEDSHVVTAGERRAQSRGNGRQDQQWSPCGSRLDRAPLRIIIIINIIIIIMIQFSGNWEAVVTIVPDPLPRPI